MYRPQQRINYISVCTNPAQPIYRRYPGYIFLNSRFLCDKPHTHTHTHPFNGPFSGTTQVSRYQKGNTKLDFCEARDSEWQWHQLGRMQVCTSLQTDNHTSTSPLSFLQAGCPSCHPTNSVKALKATVKIQVMFVVSDDFLFFSFSLRLLGRDANP